MRIDFDENRDHMVVSIPGQDIIDFDILVYKQAKINQVADVLSVVNAYLQTLEPEIHEEMFELYGLSKQLMIEMEVPEVTDQKLMQVIAKLVELIDLERLRRWTVIHSGIHIPLDIKEDFSEVEDVFERGRTYLRYEYMDLLTICIAVRFILPIWGEYMFIIRDVVSEFSRELRAYSLLRKSIIASHPAYERLMLYIEKSFDENVKTTSATVSGIGREEIPEWFCALLLVRRLSIVDLTSTLKPPNIIHNLHGYVKDSMDNLQKKFKETINTKKPQKAGDGEKDPSFLETYRVKQEIPYGVIDTYNVFFQDVFRIVHSIDKTVPNELIAEVIEITHGLEHEHIGPHNVLLTKWVLQTLIPQGMLDMLEKVSVIKGMIATQAILHAWGFHASALIATGIELNGQINVIGDVVHRLTVEQLDKIDAIYPFSLYPAKGKQRPLNKVTEEIYNLSAELISVKKAVRTPRFLTAEQVPYIDRYGHLTTPAFIAIELAEILFMVNNRGFNNEHYECSTNKTIHH